MKFYIRVAYKGGIGFLPEGVGTPLKTVDQMISNYGYFLTTQISLKGYHSKLDSSVCLFVCFSHFLPLKRIGGLEPIEVAMV